MHNRRFSFVSQQFHSFTETLLFPAKTCTGICMAERIADYCDAVLAIDTLCKSGYKCCVSRDAFGDAPPPELLIIDRANSSRFDEKTALNISYKGPSSSTTLRPNTVTSTSISVGTMGTIATTGKPQTTTTRPKITVKTPCKGECVSGFFALLCDKVDGEAECPDDGSCCVIDAFLKTVNTMGPHESTYFVYTMIHR